MRSDAERHIDEIFGDPRSIKSDDFIPVVRRENLSELLEARLTVRSISLRCFPDSKNAELTFCHQLPFSLPTANEALLMHSEPYFGNVAVPHSMQDPEEEIFSISDSSGHHFIMGDPEPYLPDDFFERLAAAQEQYDGLLPAKGNLSLHESKRRRSNILGISVATPHRSNGDHWLNWRARLAQELADTEYTSAFV